MTEQPRRTAFGAGIAALVFIAHGLVSCQSVSSPTEVGPAGNFVEPGALPQDADFDCSDGIHHDISSASTAEIVDAFVQDFRRQQPTEYMGFEQLWGVDEAEGFLLIQGMVTQEESDLIVVRRTTEGLEMAARITSHLRDLTADSAVAELRGQAPDIPEALLACADLTRFLKSLAP